MRRTFLFIAAAAVALVLVSCRAEINITLDVEEDGSGTAAFELGTDEEFREAMGSIGAGDPDELVGDIEFDFIDGTVIEREEGEMSFQGVEIEFDDTDEITGFLIDASSDFFREFATFSFEIDDSSAVLDATLAAEQDLGDIPFDLSQFTGNILSVNFTVSMPGTVTVHNADKVLADGRLRWELPLFGGTIEVHAESEFGQGNFPWLWLLLGIALLIGVVATIAAVVLGRRQQRRAVSDAAAAYPQEAPVAAEHETSTEPDEAASAMEDGVADEAGDDDDTGSDDSG